MFESKQFVLSRAKTLAYLDEIAAAGVARTIYLPPGLSRPQAQSILEEYVAEPVPTEAAGLIVGSKTGAVFFWNSAKSYLILPPFPVDKEYSAPGCVAEPLRSRLQNDAGIALVLVRLGSYAIGLCRGEKLIASKVGTGLIHARHRQGGSSAQRFGLHRQKQIEAFMNRVCEHIQEKLGPQAKAIDYIAYGGARTSILLLQKHCPFLQKLDRELPPLLDIAEPRQAVLEAAVGRVWSSRVVEWQAA